MKSYEQTTGSQVLNYEIDCDKEYPPKFFFSIIPIPGIVNITKLNLPNVKTLGMYAIAGGANNKLISNLEK